MNQYNVFNCQFTAVQLSLGRECCLSGKEALVEVMSKDFLEVKWNFLSDPKLNVHYLHEYENTKQKDVYVMRVANKRVYKKAMDFIEDDTQIRYPYLYAIVDIRQETPTIMIEDYKEVPSSLEEVSAVLTYSINKAMKAKGWEVKLKSENMKLHPIPLSLRPIMDPLLNKPRTIEEFHGVNNIWEIYIKKKEPKDFRNAIKEKYKEKAHTIMNMLHRYIDDAETPDEAIMAIVAAMVAKIIRRPTWSEFHHEFPKAKCSKSSLERLTDCTKKSYEDSCAFKSLITEFLGL